MYVDGIKYQVTYNAGLVAELTVDAYLENEKYSIPKSVYYGTSGELATSLSFVTPTKLPESLNEGKFSDFALLTNGVGFLSEISKVYDDYIVEAAKEIVGRMELSNEVVQFFYKETSFIAIAPKVIFTIVEEDKRMPFTTLQ